MDRPIQELARHAAYALPMLQIDNCKARNTGNNNDADKRASITSNDQKFNKFAKNNGIKTATIYGGQGMGIQLDALRKKTRDPSCHTW